MGDPEVHIAAWQDAGLIDAALADRLRAASINAAVHAPDLGTSPVAGPEPGIGGLAAGDAAQLPTWIPVTSAAIPTSEGSFFGPSLAMGELFGYLGAGFLLGAWLAFLSTFGDSQNREVIIASGQAIGAVILFGLGFTFRLGDARRRRASGIAFAATTVLAAGCAIYVVQMDFLRNTLQDQAPPVLITGVAFVVAASLRRLLPAVVTQFTLVASIVGLAGALLSWLTALVYPQGFFDGGGAVSNPAPQPAEPIGLLFAGAAWWLIIAVGLGILGMREARSVARDPSAARRAAITRFLAGLVAVVGTEAALTQTGNLGDFSYGRLLEPWVADVIILVVALVLLQRAIARDATSFVLAGALGLIIALTDFNYSYLADSTYVGLLIEGVILLGVGFAAERLRRVVTRSH